MHTACFLTVSPSIHCVCVWGGGGSTLPREFALPRGSALSRGEGGLLAGVSSCQWGSCLPGRSALPGGLPCQGGVCLARGSAFLGGVSLPGGLPCWYPSMQWGRHPLPSLWIEFLTHTCENITLPQTPFAGGKNISICFGNSKMRMNIDTVADQIQKKQKLIDLFVLQLSNKNGNDSKLKLMSQFSSISNFFHFHAVFSKKFPNNSLVPAPLGLGHPFRGIPDPPF